MCRSSAVGSFPCWHYGAGDLPRRTGAGASHQIDGEVFLGEVFAVGTARNSGHRLPPSIDECLAGAAVAVSSVPRGLHHRHTGAGLALLHKLQRSQIVQSVARQHVHCGDQLGVGVPHHGGLVPVEALAHLGIVHQHHPVPAHPIFQADLASVISVSIGSIASVVAGPPRCTSWNSNWASNSACCLGC